MDRPRHPADDLMHQAAMSYFAGGREPRQEGPPTEQRIPVNVFETENDIVIAAPMPGVEADNIDIEVDGQYVTLRATLRGPKQERRRYLVHEWTYGPYVARVQLPIEVDASAANASHGNGVLMLTLPKAARSRAVKVPLRQVTTSEARHEGHSGHSSSE